MMGKMIFCCGSSFSKLNSFNSESHVTSEYDDVGGAKSYRLKC